MAPSAGAEFGIGVTYASLHCPAGGHRFLAGKNSPMASRPGGFEEQGGEALKNVEAMDDAPNVRSVHAELVGVDPVEGEELPGAFIGDELLVKVRP